MAKTQYLHFIIHLTDAAEVARLQGIPDADPGSNQAVGAIIRAPAGAAVEFGAPILAKAAAFVAPCITSDWFYTDANYPINVATFTRKSGGWFGIPSLFGTTTRFYWRGIFAYAGDPAVSPITGETPVAMARRRWIDGFELPDLGEGGSGNGAAEEARCAGRHLEGFGLKLSNSALYKQHVPEETIGSAARCLWERLYIRPRKLGTTYAILHSVRGATSGAAGVNLVQIPSGQITIENVDSSGVRIPLVTLAGPSVNGWTRADILWCFAGGTEGGPYYRLYLNGSLAWEGDSVFGGAGLGQAQLAGNSKVGNSPAGNGFDLEYDDWIGSDLPEVGSGDGIYPGQDWNNGSRVVRVAVDHASATNGTWTGPFQLLKQRPTGQSVPQGLASSTASDRASYVTDAAKSVDRIKNAVGIAALLVAKVGSRVGVGNGDLGYKLPGEAEALTAITENTVVIWNRVPYFPTGVVTPLTPLADLEIVHVHNGNASAATMHQLQAVAEVLGQFYDEDKNPSSDAGQETIAAPPRQLLKHNAPYPRTPWAQSGPPPISPLLIKGATYVGNGTVIEIPLEAPPHLVIIRQVTDPNIRPLIWLSSNLAGHDAGRENCISEGPVEVLQDPAFADPVAEDDQSLRFLIRIAGNTNLCNASGKTYQLIAFCDPGMRFALADGLADAQVDYAHAIGYPSWTPEWAFLQGEDATTSTTMRAYIKGIGHDLDSLSPIDATEIAAGLTFAANALTVRSGLATPLANPSTTPFILFRRADGNNDPDQARVLQLCTYTGDGAASRTIGLTPASGRRPLFAIVTPHNAASYHRDPSHATNNSQGLTTGTLLTTGITAGGIDQITVGATLNSNGIDYDVLVFPGSTTAGNGGWSINGDFWPVEPTSPAEGGPWGDEPDEPGEVPAPPAPEPEPGEEEFDFSEDCIEPSTKIINKALSYIGVSKQVGDILTEASAEAVTARLHFSDDVSATLRDYPWAFATRYETLTLVKGPATGITTVQAWAATVAYEVDDAVDLGGTIYYCVLAHTNHTPPNTTYWMLEAPEHANGDWLYAYRAPVRMIFARRIVNPDGSKRDFDPDPPRFRTGTDEAGTIIYTDVEDPELEYTARLPCVAQSGDAIFRKALTWRHAASLAPALARDEKRVDFCMGVYLATLEEARAKDAAEQQQSPEGDVDWIRGRD